jgi:hypothetical protein
VEWINLAQVRVQWWTVLNGVNRSLGSMKSGEFLASVIARLQGVSYTLFHKSLQCLQYALILNNLFILPTECVYVSRVILRMNSELRGIFGLYNGHLRCFL